MNVPKKISNKKNHYNSNAIGIFAFFAVFVFLIFFMSIIGLIHYNQVYQNPLTVTATVKEHKSDEDYSNDSIVTTYESIISYTVDGKEYSFTYEQRNSYVDLTPVGRQVEIQVSPKYPGIRISDLEAAVAGVFSGAPLFFIIIAAAYMFLIKNMRSKGIQHEPDLETIERDMRLTIQARFFRPLTFFLWVFYALLSWIYPTISSDNMSISFAVTFGVIWLLCMFITIRDYSYIKNEKYEIRRLVLIQKIHTSRSDANTYELLYKSGDTTWKTRTNKDQFFKIKEGDVISAVYLPKKKKPLIHYDINGTAK